MENANGTANDLLLGALKKRFPNAIHDGEAFSLDDESLRHSLKLLKDIDLANSPSHTFGDAFQALMGPRLRGDKGQFFTPRSVVRAMVSILEPCAGEMIIDPAMWNWRISFRSLGLFAGRKCSWDIGWHRQG